MPTLPIHMLGTILPDPAFEAADDLRHEKQLRDRIAIGNELFGRNNQWRAGVKCEGEYRWWTARPATYAIITRSNSPLYFERRADGYDYAIGKQLPNE